MTCEEICQFPLDIAREPIHYFDNWQIQENNQALFILLLYELFLWIAKKIKDRKYSFKVLEIINKGRMIKISALYKP